MSNELPDRPWREHALDESLRGFNHENYHQALMVAIRRAQPSWPSVQVDVERARALEFFRSCCAESRSLLGASHKSLRERNKAKETHAAIWHCVEWEQGRFEVAFVLSEYYSTAVCLSPQGDAHALDRFTQALRQFCIRPMGRSLSLSGGSWESAEDLDAEIGRITWDDVVLPPPMLRDIREAIEGFFAHRDAIKAFGFAWKRGVLLVGPPGTGKTMICKAVAAASPDFPFLYVRNLDGYSPIPTVFERARALAPCVLAFEDIDGFLDEDNRSVFLNEMDGFQSNEGILIIASSNHPGKIDEALLKRPSRFDRVFHIGLPAKAERHAFCERLLTRESLAPHLAPDFDIPALAERVADATDGFTPAYLKEAFLAAALSRAQNGATTLDEAFADAVLAQVVELKAHLKKVKNPDALAEMRSGDEMIGLRR